MFMATVFTFSSIDIEISFIGVSHCIVLPMEILIIDIIVIGTLLFSILFCSISGDFFIGIIISRRNSRIEYVDVKKII